MVLVCSRRLRCSAACISIDELLVLSGILSLAKAIKPLRPWACTSMDLEKMMVCVQDCELLLPSPIPHTINPLYSIPALQPAFPRFSPCID